MLHLLRVVCAHAMTWGQAQLQREMLKIMLKLGNGNSRAAAEYVGGRRIKNKNSSPKFNKGQHMRCETRGKNGHATTTCSHNGKSCHSCGGMGHLAAACPTSRAAQEKCACCGKEGHAKKDCAHKDKVCSTCGKAGHLKAVCRASPMVTPAKTYAGAAAATKELEAEMYKWKCSSLKCGQWMHTDASTKCTACGLPRVKEKAKAAERECLETSKTTEELLGRLQVGDDDELME